MKTTHETPKTGLFDLIFEIAGILGLLLLIGLPSFFYSRMPDEIPIHFGISGFADGWGAKKAIWLLPVIAIVIYLGLSFLNYFLIRTTPSGKLDAATEIRQKKGVYSLLQFLKAMLSISFAYLVFAAIQVSRGNQEGLGKWFLPVFIILLTIVPIFFAMKIASKKSFK